MRERDIAYNIVEATLGTFNQRQPFSPGMFEPLKPLFKDLGYDNAVVYITDDFPDRMHAECVYGDEARFPAVVTMERGLSLQDILAESVAGLKGVLIGRLFNHGRELGALAVTCRSGSGAKARESFDMLVRTISIMAYVERIRTNSRRERLERDVFFAQSLTNRLLIRDIPDTGDLRVGVEFQRCLEAGGDFFDLNPTRDGGVTGYIGCCNGKGLRTVMEVCSIMRTINRRLIATGSLTEAMRTVNEYLVEEKGRGHQASLCFFNVDPRQKKLRLVKSGRMGILLFDPHHTIQRLSAHGGIFLGMVPDPKIEEETFDFIPGSALFCVTEGFFNAVSVLGCKPDYHWFVKALQDTLAEKADKPLANAAFERVTKKMDFGFHAEDSMLSISVEYPKKNRAARSGQ